MVTEREMRGDTYTDGSRPPTAGRHRFVPREALAEVVARSEPVDRERFRRDLDEVADPWFETMG